MKRYAAKFSYSTVTVQVRVFCYFDRGRTWLEICQQVRYKHFVTDLQILNEKAACNELVMARKIKRRKKLVFEYPCYSSIRTGATFASSIKN